MQVPRRRHSLSLVALCALAACSVVPPRGVAPYEEREVEVEYRFDAGPHPVRVPASRPGLTILSLTTQPGPTAERFTEDGRFLVPQWGAFSLRCRYRATQQDSGEGPRPIPPPEDLFPDATHVRTLWVRGATSAADSSGLDPDQG